MRISEILNLPKITGHTQRHPMASHLLKNDQITEDQIRIILGHSNIATTKIYLREKHGDGQSHNIMKRFLETILMN
jgi:site-specific recombinase XerD